MMIQVYANKAASGLLLKPRTKTEEERIAKIREHQRRKQKEKLYGYHSISQ
jgi:hypothetical protein